MTITTATRILLSNLQGSDTVAPIQVDAVDGRTRYGMAFDTTDDDEGWIEIFDGDEEPIIYWR